MDVKILQDTTTTEKKDLMLILSYPLQQLPCPFLVFRSFNLAPWMHRFFVRHLFYFQRVSLQIKTCMCWCESLSLYIYFWLFFVVVAKTEECRRGERATKWCTIYYLVASMNQREHKNSLCKWVSENRARQI